jgi:hypothetical protein
MDPHWFSCGIGSSFFGQRGFGSRDLMKKISKHFTVKHILKNITLYLSLGLHEKRPKLQEKPSALTENIQHFKTIYNFSFLSVFAHLNPDRAD